MYLIFDKATVEFCAAHVTGKAAGVPLAGFVGEQAPYNELEGGGC